MKERENLSKLSLLALQKRKEGLLKRMPPLGQTLRGSLLERYMTCGKPTCKCARGQRHGPVWYLSVTLGPAHTTGVTVPVDQLDQVRAWIANYHQAKDFLEKISEINLELLRRERNKSRR